MLTGTEVSRTEHKVDLQCGGGGQSLGAGSEWVDTPGAAYEGTIDSDF